MHKKYTLGGMAGAVPQGIYYRTQFSYERYVNKGG